MERNELVKYIDHTILKPDASRAEINRIAQEAIDYGFKAICIPPYFVKDVFQILENTQVELATVIGFPMGYSTTAAKVEEIKRAISDGADELDVVVNIAAVKDGAWLYVKNDIESMVRAGHLKGKTVKVIIESGLLTMDEIAHICPICVETEADFVKTSTGFGPVGATPEMIKHLRTLLPANMKIKASGGIKTREQALALIAAGANRIGTSAALDIVK